MKYQGFDGCLVQLRRRGGPYQRAGEQVYTLIGRLEADPDAKIDLPTTHFGENRIKKAVKYDLSGRCRLITIQDSGYIFLCFVGDHEECDRWLTKHKGMALKAEDGKPLATFESVNVATPEERIERGAGLSRELLVNLLPIAQRNSLTAGLSRLVQRAIEAMDALVSDDELLETVEAVHDQLHRTALFDTLILLRGEDVVGATRRVKVFTGELKDIQPTIADHEWLADSADFHHIPIDSEHYRKLIEHYAKHAEYRDWMLFMHPDQQKFVDDSYTGPAKLSGVSGSGKTCVVVNRAISLAARYPDERVLIVTLNKSLAKLIQDLVEKAALPELRQRIDVRPLFKVCQELLHVFEPENDKLYDDLTWKSHEHIDEIWREFYRCEVNNYDARVLQRLHDSLIARGIDAESYIREEFDWIRSAVTPDARERYLTIERGGRGYAMDPEFRRELLEGLTRWEIKMLRIGVTDYIGLANALYKHVDRILPSHRCVLVDESQDFGTTELKIVRRLYARDDNEHESDNIFLCGDAAQRVSAKHQSLGEADMLVPGARSFKLSLNYRNSREILSLAYAILVDNLTEEMIESRDFEVLDPQFANFSGPVPLLLNAESLAEEVGYALAYARQEVDANDAMKVCIAICGYSQHEMAAFARRMELPLLDSHIDLSEGKVFLSDLENTKGFEFQCMIILNAGEDVLPSPRLPEKDRYRDLSRFYVAMTRARQQLVVSYSKAPSQYIGKNRAKFLEERWASYVDVANEELLTARSPTQLEQIRHDHETPDSLVQLGGEQFLYRDEAIGLPLALIQRIRECVSGKSVTRNGVPVEWRTIGDLLRDVATNPRSRQAFGTETVNLLRQHVLPMAQAELSKPRRRLGRSTALAGE